MSLKTIEQAIVAHACHLGVRTGEIYHDRNKDTIVELRDIDEINVSELARAIQRAVTVRID